MVPSSEFSKQDTPPGTGDKPISREQFNQVVRAAESERIKERRQHLQGAATALGSDDATQPPGNDLVGLALSGGGIRSATFNLGVLQRLAELKILPLVDYLSTVSGGGYVGAWWSSWMYRLSAASGHWLPSPNPATPADEPPGPELADSRHRGTNATRRSVPHNARHQAPERVNKNETLLDGFDVRVELLVRVKCTP